MGTGGEERGKEGEERRREALRRREVEPPICEIFWGGGGGTGGRGECWRWTWELGNFVEMEEDEGDGRR